MESAAAAPHEVLVNAAMPTPAVTAAPDQGTQNQGIPGQEFVVLTTWEAVQTSSPNSRTVADYEMDASDQEQTDHADMQPDTNQGAQITVTRMILVFYPASAYPASAYPASAYPASAAASVQPAPTGSPSHRPTASYGGWLFFQL
jgi:hypothetical protein